MENDNTLISIIAASIVAAAGLWRFIPQLKTMFNKDKKYVTISISESDFISALKDNSEYTIKKIREELAIPKRQEMEIQDAIKLAKTKVIEQFEIHRKKNKLEDATKKRFENALDCVLSDIVEMANEEFDRNHFLERENWNEFLNNISEIFYQTAFNKLKEKFPEIEEMKDLYVALEQNLEQNIKNKIEEVFNNARKHIVETKQKLQDMDKEYDEQVRKRYLGEE